MLEWLYATLLFMTRINLIKPSELSDQWLIAEYRELPRVLKGKFNTSNAPIRYKLGTGHVKWARQYGLFLQNRFTKLIKEMQYRGFKTNFNDDLCKYITNDIKNDYKPDLADLTINKERLIEKYKEKPNFYKWTKREKPKFLKTQN